MKIVLYIDRLVLRGIDVADAGALAQALQSELQGLLAAPGVASTWASQGSAHALRADSVTVAHQADATALGRAAAGAIAARRP
jgi:hypothetical protein